MAILQVRQRGTQDAGVLPQVRQVDYSGIGNNALTRHQASGGIGVDIQSAVKGIAHGISSTVEAWNARDEREAVEQAEKVRTALVMDKAKFLRDLETGAIEFKSTEDVVAEWDKHVEKIKGNVAGKIGAPESYLRRCFDRATQNLFDNAAVEVFRAGNTSLDKKTQTAATALLQNSLHDIVEADPDKRATNAFDETLVQAQHAFRWTDEEMKVKRREYKEALGVACANRAIAEAATSTDLDKINEAIINIGVDKPTEAQRQGVQKVFGTIDASAITPEKRVAIQDAIRRKRANLVQAEAAGINAQNDNLLNAYFNGKISFGDAKRQIEKINTSAATRESTVNALNREFERKSTVEVSNAWAIVSQSDGFKEVSPTENLKALDALVPEEAKTSKYYATFRKMAENGLVEVYEKERERTADTLIEQIVDDLSLSEEEANARLEQEVFGVYGEIYGGESGHAKMDKIKKRVHAERQINVTGYRSYVRGLLGDNNQHSKASIGYTFGQGQSIREGVPITYDSDGYINVNATYKAMESAALGWEVDAKGTDFADFEPAIKSALNVLRSADARVRQLAAEHPDWTTKQLTDIFNELVPQEVMNTLLIQEYSSKFDSAAVIEAMTIFESDTMGSQDYNTVLGAATAAGDKAEPKEQPSERERSMNYKNKNLNSL